MRATSGGRGPRRDRAQVERLVERLLVHAVVAGHLAQRAPAPGRVLDDFRRAVIPDERVERRGDGERSLCRALEALAVGLDPVDALGGEQLARAGQQVDRLQEVARDQRDAYVELELALQ